MAVKPILGMVPPDPTSLAPARSRGPAEARQALPRRSGAEQFHALHKLMTMSSADYLDEWFETDALKATKSASGIIGTFLGPRSPGHRVRAAAPLHGRDRRRVPRLGLRQGRHRRDQRGDRGAAARASGAEIRTERRRSTRVLVKNGRATGVVLENGEEIRAPHRGLGPRPATAPSCSWSSAKELPDDFARRHQPLQVPRLVGQGEPAPSARCRTSPACPASARTCAARSRSAPASTTWSAPTTTPSTASSPAQPVHGHRDPLDDRSGHGAARAST